jgi:tetratricopeptide (TPR) repeat protein
MTMAVPPNNRELARGFVEAGEAHLSNGASALAAIEFERAVQRDPSHPRAHLGLARARAQQLRRPEAEAAAKAALQADPSFAPAAHFLGNLLVEMDRCYEALPHLEAACALQPELLAHQRDLGGALLYVGDLARGRAHLMRALDIDGRATEVLITLIRMSDMSDGSPQSAHLFQVARDLAERDDLPAEDLALALFALGKAFEDRKDYAAATRAWARANALRRPKVDFDLTETEARLRRIAEVFDEDLMSRLSRNGVRSVRPIFIVGMPRSGSTLVEQILSAHPAVQAGGELSLLGVLVNRIRGRDGEPYPEWAMTMGAGDLLQIGQFYLNHLRAPEAGQTRTTDKGLPDFEHLGLIALALPGAKIIHCQRDPRDQLFSCWAMHFGQTQKYAYVYDVAELRRYHQAYLALMEHWRRVLPPGLMLDVQYERLVADPEAETRRILDHCALEWDANVLRFWEARRAVRSASLTQVREPVYDRSIGRWRPFAQHLPDLLGKVAVNDGEPY